MPATLPVILPLFLAFLIGGCASHNEAPMTLEQRLAQKGLQQGESVRRINRFVIDGWQYLDDSHILISSVGRDRYLVTFAMPCIDTAFASDISFSTTAEALTPMDKVFVRGESRHHGCPIFSIHHLDPLPQDDEPAQ